MLLLLPATFLLSFLGTWLIIYLSRRYQWLDQPNSRSSHNIPIPSSGGLAFVVVFVFASGIFFQGTSPGFNYQIILLLCSVIALLGLFDDIYKLGIVVRITTQLLVVAGALALFGVPSIPVFSVVFEPGLPGYFILALAFLWFINLFNFMDGIDGLAAIETLFIGLAVTFITFSDSTSDFRTFLLLLVSAVSGFLLLNFSPARIFMGDIGSNFLGYTLGVAALVSSATGITNIWVWCILAGVFIVDATYTLLKRMLNGETWYFAHRTHAYQLAAVRFKSHGKIVAAITLINLLWLLPLAWLAHEQPGWGLGLTILAWLPLCIATRMISVSPAFNKVQD